QTLDVLHTRAEPLGIEIDGVTIDENTAALLVSWPDTFGVYGDHKAAIEKARTAGALVVFVADPLGLQTREQHIRRDKATSNICTAQALLANMAAAYAIWHGPAGLQAIAGRVHGLASRLADGLKAAGFAITGSNRFDTVTVEAKGKAKEIAVAAEKSGRLLRLIDADRISIAFDETSTEADLEAIAALFGAKASGDSAATMPGKPRGKEFLTQPAFHENRSETEMMRFLRRLADKDLALDRAMIPLGSCT